MTLLPTSHSEAKPKAQALTFGSIFINISSGQTPPGDLHPQSGIYLASLLQAPIVHSHNFYRLKSAACCKEIKKTMIVKTWGSISPPVSNMLAQLKVQQLANKYYIAGMPSLRTASASINVQV